MAAETAAKTDLKIDNLITVRFGCDGKNIILTFGGVAHLIINDAILKDIVLLGMMAVAIKTELQTGKIEGVIVEHLGHIVVKLLRIRGGMHTDDGAFKAVGIFLHLFFHKIEVGHRARVVVLDGVCVQTHKLNAARNKAEVGIAKNNLVGLVTRTQTVVVAQQGNKGFIKRFQQVAAPKIFFRSTKVGYIATMHHKVDIGTTVDVAYLGLGIIKPLMGVADEGKTYGFFVVYALQ